MGVRMSKDTDPPSIHCIGCQAWQFARTWRRWSIVVVGAILAALVPVGVIGATACTSAAENRAEMRTMQTAQQTSRDERQRLAGEQVRAERESALRWEKVASTLARIEARLDAAEARVERPARRRER